MLVILGLVIVIGAVLTGYTAHGGKVGVLIQPTEFIIIGGAALGSLLAATSMSVVKGIIKGLTDTMKLGPTKAQFNELLLLLFELCKTAKTNPLSLEPHIESPESSEIFGRYPALLGNHHLIHFICDTLKVQISSPMSPYDLEDLMDIDINSAHEEELKPSAALNKVSDAMPGLGIVAAVLGVVITMGKLTQGKEVIGHSVAAALTGTFFGVLLCYGVIGPIASKMEARVNEDSVLIHVAKAALLAFAKNASPKVCVEFARRKIPPTERPSFDEVDQATSNAKKAA